MSGAVKSVTKTFKKITKSAVGKFVVAAAVSYFTAGLGASVLGATGLGAGLSPTMTTVLSHAISGAATGGIMSGVSGGNIGKGLLLGAAGGAVMGGVQSALGNYTTLPGQANAASPASASAKTVQANANAPQAAQAQTGAIQSGSVGNNTTNAANAASGGVTAPAMPAPINVGYAPGVVPAVGAPGQGNFIDTSTFSGTKTFYNPATGGSVNVAGTGKTGLMGWVDRNPEIAGKMISEGASGALKAVVAGDNGGSSRDYTGATQVRVDADKADQQRIMASHSGTGGLLQPGANTQPTGSMTPSQRWNTSETGYSNGRWVFDQNQGKVVFVPNAATPAA